MAKRITIIGGAFGSGKTEFAVAYAQKKAAAGEKVGLVDLDIVNPYFRSRDLTAVLAERGLTVVSSEPGLEHSDIPALSPRIYALLQDRSYQVIFDVGGDPVGARALGRFNRYFGDEPYDFWMALNPFRPDTRTAADVVKLAAAIETAGRVQLTGLISNINLGFETTLDLWREGIAAVEETAARLRLPVIYHLVEAKFLTENKEFFAAYPVFSLTPAMLPPWLADD